MSKPLRSLLDHRVIVVTGKGGTGKTTVTAILGEAARRAGQKVLIAETAPVESVAYLFEDRAQPLGYAGRELQPGLVGMRIDPFSALAEYLGLQIGLRSLADRVLHTETFQQLLEAVPGWRELIILGKVWHLEQQREPNGRPTHDLIIVDAPSTGHGLTFLDVPRVVQQAVRTGPLTRHASWVEDLIHDRERTLLLPVTLPEELPVLETAELVDRARKSIDIAVDRIIVNNMPHPVEQKFAGLLERLSEDLVLNALPPVKVLREIVAHDERREALAFEERARLAEICALPVVDLPFTPRAFEPPRDWSRLVEAILQPPVWPASDADDPRAESSSS